MDAVTGDIGVAPAQETPRRRLDWLDVAKGMGITLVVIGHAIGGVLSSSLPGKSAFLPYVNAGIYTFHMDLFFFLSGLTVAVRIDKNPGDFLRKTFTKIAFAYFVWAFVQYNVIYFAGNLANAPIQGYSLLIFLTGNVSQFWFLYVLFFYYLITWALLRRVGPVALLAVALAVRPFWGLGAPGTNIGYFLLFALPYMAGVALGAGRLDGLLRGLRPWPVAALAILALAELAFIVSPAFGGIPADMTDGQKIIDFVYSMPVLPTSILACAALICVSALVRGPATRHLAYLGRMSLPIFILHIMCIAGTRIVLAKLLHVSSFWLILAIIVPAGLVMPLVAVRVLDRLRLARPLGLL